MNKLKELWNWLSTSTDNRQGSTVVTCDGTDLLAMYEESVAKNRRLETEVQGLRAAQSWARLAFTRETGPILDGVNAMPEALQAHYLSIVQENERLKAQPGLDERTRLQAAYYPDYERLAEAQGRLAVVVNAIRGAFPELALGTSSEAIAEDVAIGMLKNLLQENAGLRASDKNLREKLR